jgi:hypothetical protein
MHMIRMLGRATVAAAALAFAIGLSAAIAASGFVGKFKTTDTEGKPFTIWLSEDGKAKGDRADEGLAGMWKEEGGAAVITWESGWVTKLTTDGEAYSKSTEQDGKAVGTPTKAEKTE